MSDRPTVSVVIPVWNGEATLRACLDALQGQSYAREAVELLVVDNGSTDSTLQILADYPAATVLHEPQPGSYGARNRGLAAAQGEFVAFTDADCVPRVDWLERAVQEALVHPQAAIVGGRIELFGLDGHSELCRSYENILSFDQQRYIEHGHCATANWLSPLALIRELGGFDARLKSGGDFELSGRVSAAGHELVYCPEMVVGHPCRGSLHELVRKRRRITGGQWTGLDSAQRRLKYLLGVGYHALLESKKLMAQPGLPLGHRLRLCGVSLALAGAQYVELGSLVLGGQPRRA